MRTENLMKNETYYLRLRDDEEMDGILAVAEAYRKRALYGWPYLRMEEIDILVERLIQAYASPVLRMKTLWCLDSLDEKKTLLQRVLERLPCLREMENRYVIYADNEISEEITLERTKKQVELTIKIMQIAKHFFCSESVPGIDWDWISKTFNDNSLIKIVDFTFEKIEDSENMDESIDVGDTQPNVKKYRLKFLPEIQMNENLLNVYDPILDSIFNICDYYYKYRSLRIRHVAFLTKLSTCRLTQSRVFGKLKWVVQTIMMDDFANLEKKDTNSLDLYDRIFDWSSDEESNETSDEDKDSSDTTDSDEGSSDDRDYDSIDDEGLEENITDEIAAAENYSINDEGLEENTDSNEDVKIFVEAFLYVHFREYSRDSTNATFQLHSREISFAWKLLSLDTFFKIFFTIALTVENNDTHVDFYRTSTTILNDRLTYVYDVDQKYLRCMRKIYIDISKCVNFEHGTCNITRFLLPLSFFVSRKVVRKVCKRIIVRVLRYCTARRNIGWVTTRTDLSDALDIVDLMLAFREISSIRRILYRDDSSRQTPQNVKRVTNIRNIDLDVTRTNEYHDLIERKKNECILMAGHDPRTANIERFKKIPSVRTNDDTSINDLKKSNVFVTPIEATSTITSLFIRDKMKLRSTEMYERVEAILKKLRGCDANPRYFSRNKSNVRTIRSFEYAFSGFLEKDRRNSIVLDRWQIRGIECSMLKDPCYVTVVRTLLTTSGKMLNQL